jgi:N-dimethylarginine dimethylaminohydrolase
MQPVGIDKLIACPEAFTKREQYDWLINYFGKENILEISLVEMSEMCCNFFSIANNIVVSEKSFTKVNNWLRNFNITVEEINYKEISKQGGLLRCSTLPLIRDNS